MTRYGTIKLTLLAIAALAFELTLLEDLSVGGGRAEALLGLACFAALFARDTRQGLLTPWILGLLKDAASSGPMGLHALLFLGAGWVVLQVRQVLFRESALTQLGVVFLAGFWVNLAGALFVSMTAGGIPFRVLLAKVLCSAILTAGLALPLFLTIRRAGGLVR